MSNVLIGEFIGTMLLVLLGDGVCANVTLNNSGFKAAGPLFIALGWGLAVCLPAAAFSGICPASYNPALTIALFADGTLAAADGYTIAVIIEMIIAELAGGFIGAVLVWVAIATFWLVFAIKAACGAFDLGTFGVFLTIVSCGTTFGGLTGYAMNAARDTAPRLAFAILPIKGKGDADWAYGLTAPLIGPVIGALVAVAVYAALPLQNIIVI